MSYQVIARRWRPQTFSDVIGQDHVTRTLKNAILQERLAHAFLFTGPRGVGKTSTARILARAINCTGPNRKDAEPCNECETCHALFEDRELDVIEMDAASYTSVDDIRRINDVARLAPVAGDKKIFIIDEVHMLTKNAFNAFLKTLEEPPSHVVFILATTDVHKVPATIRSRVQRFDFRPLSASEIAAHMKRICEVEKWEHDEKALWLIARQADGSLRDAEGLLDQVVSFSDGIAKIDETREVLGVLSEDLLHCATGLIAEHDIRSTPAFFDDLAKSGADYSTLLQELQRHWTDLIFVKQDLALSGKTEEEYKRLQESGGDLTPDDLFRLVRLATKLEDEIKWSVVPRTRFEVAFLRWVNLDRAVMIRDLLAGSTPLPSPSPSPKPAPKSAPKSAEQPVRPPSPQVSKPPTAANGTEPKQATASKPESSALSLDLLRERWAEVVANLGKGKPAVAAVAESGWVLDSLVGNKLTICPNTPGDFHLKQMKNNFAHVTRAIAEVTGWKLILLAGKAKEAKKAAPAPKPTKAIDKPGGDLFTDVMNQFGGEEITGNQIKEPE
jgi:DNA polymerase-3 subunit gamma/tau